MTELNALFSSVFTKEDIENLPTAPEEKTRALGEVNVTHDVIKKRLMQLSKTKAPGPDEDHPNILREAAEELSEPLLLLFQKSIDTGEIPKD